MSRTYRKFNYHNFRHPKGKLQEEVALEKCKEENVHVRNREIPDAWDDISTRNEGQVVWNILDKMIENGWDDEDIKHSLHRKFDVTFHDVSEMIKNRHENLAWKMKWNNIYYKNIEKDHLKNLEITADEIIGNILEVGLKQLHQVASRWSKVYKTIEKNTSNYFDLQVIMEKKLKEIGVDYLKEYSIFQEILRPSIYLKKDKFIAVQPKD